MYDIFISYNTQDQAIADQTYARLTKEGYRCFLATRGIYSTDWGGDIMEALEHSKGFVVIISKSAAASNEVMKEVTLATRYSRFIFPLRTDDVRMDRTMEYHLAPFQWISAVIPPMELRLEELTRRIQTAFQGLETSGNYNDSRLELLSHSVSPRAEFTGREEELQAIHECFEKGDHCVFLSGMGGIGKSEVARAYAKNHRSDYDIVVMATYERGLMEMIADDRFVPVRGLSRGGVNGGQVETTESYFNRKMEVLREVVTPRTLFIIDNFDVEEDPQLDAVLELGCHFLITTRTNFEDLGYECIFLEPMDPQKDLLPMMERLDRPYRKEEERADALSIIEVLDRHTYAVSLTASQMKAGHIKPAKMLEMLRKEGLRYQTRSTFARTTASQKGTAYSYIHMLFDFSGLGEEYVKLLQCLYCAPLEGIDIDLFMELTGTEDFDDIRRLINLNWIQQDVENDTIRLHMLVRELIEADLKPTIEDVRTYFTNLDAKINNAWNYPYVDNLIYLAPTLAMLQRFPDLTQEYLRVWDGYSTFAWIMNEFEIAEKYALKQYELACKKHGEVSQEASFFALRVAAVYHNQNDLLRARPWYRKGKEVYAIFGGMDPDTTLAYFKYARSDMQTGHYEEAERGFKEILKLMEEIERTEQDATSLYRIKVQKPSVVVSLAQIYGGRGEFDKAISMAEEQVRFLKEELPEKRGVFYSFITVLAMLYSVGGDWEKAEACILEANEIILEFHGECTVATLQGLEIYGDILVQAGRLTEAANQYKQALNRMEKYFPGSHEGIKKLTEKYEKSKEGESFLIPFRYIAL